MEAFVLGRDIVNPNLLWGRKEHIDGLSSIARRRENATIIGSRRYGKTCLLRSMVEHLRDSNSPAYPIFFDAKSDMVSGDTRKFYRYILSHLIVQMHLDQLLPNKRVFLLENIKLKLSDNWVDINEQLEGWSIERVQNALLFLAKTLSSNDKYLLLILDEIDYVLEKAFEHADNFMWIRKAASDSDYLKFWIAATSSWGSLCTSVGSPELNCGLQECVVQPLNKEDFHLLWEYECSMIEDEMFRQEILSKEDWVYQESGGVPFYAKKYGEELLKHRGDTKVLNYSILYDYFDKLVKNRFITKDEVELLHRMSVEPIGVEDNIPACMIPLCKKGLVVRTEFEYVIPVGAFRQYLKATAQNVAIEEILQENTPCDEIPTLVSDILLLRREINRIWKDNQLVDKEPYRVYANQHLGTGRHPNRFPPFCSKEPEAEYKYIEDMRRICISEIEYEAFSSSFYKFYYEGTNKAWNLPLGFALGNRNVPSDPPSRFVQILNTNRHYFGGHDAYQATTTNMSSTDLLNVINGGRQPRNGDYIYIQHFLLEECKKELEAMFTFLQGLG